MSSYRTELAGILAALYFLNTLCNYLKQQGVPNLNVSWVKAHQDNKTLIGNLPLDAVLNCKANKDAESFHLTTRNDLQPKLTPPELPLTK
eukprot:7230105-Ditylum_brightwellii.AAC.1